MIGVLELLCDGFAEIILQIILFNSWALLPWAITSIFAASLGGIYRYGRCMPSYSLPRVLFFGSWPLMLMVAGMAGWIIYYFHGRTCDAWIALTIWVVQIIFMGLWPASLFVLSSLMLTVGIFVVAWILTVAFMVWTCIEHFSIVVLLLEILILVYLTYMVVWSFFFWRVYGTAWKRPIKVIYNSIEALFTKSEADIQKGYVALQY